ncbi:MAG TPA: hypothetical protein VKY92_05275 [Verrucomicrobiae bacterium]|nr:hypothetical protein [Verrucomicrobiae bacterium]
MEMEWKEKAWHAPIYARNPGHRGAKYCLKKAFFCKDPFYFTIDVGGNAEHACCL